MMKLLSRVCFFAYPLIFSVLLGTPLAGYAQESGVLPTQKILVVAREYLKPGKEGPAHESAESAFVAANAASKNPSHYYAVTALSGPSRALFLYGYPSFAAWETEHKSIQKEESYTAALDRAAVADGDLLSSADSSVWMMRDDLSLNPGFRVGAHLMEFTVFTVRPGHYSEWEELVKLVLAGYKKGVPAAHWSAYEEAFGSPGGGFLVITSIKSASDLDEEFAQDKNFVAAMGEEGMKKMQGLEAACVESRQSNLFLISPKMSFPPDAFVKADPEFWKPAAH
jgi:hypothetical protein